MRITETMTFGEYWADPRFRLKRPDLSGSNMMCYGDNIYRRDTGGEWLQTDSHHSLPGGVTNPINLKDDTKTDRVLVSSDYWYFGSCAPTIPSKFRGEGKSDICTRRGHKVNFAPGLVEDFLTWVKTLPSGYRGRPDRWPT
jgi:hypothetical protein